MSKYTKNITYSNDLTSPLVKGEELYWEGKPKKSAFVMNQILGMMPIALLWLAIDSGIIFGISSNIEDTKMLLFIIPFFALHLLPVWIWLSNVLTANKKWKNTKYYVTNKRIIIQKGLIAENYQSIYYKDITNVSLHIGISDKIQKVADIYFSVTNGTNTGAIIFFDIENYREVYDRVQRIIVDIQTDIEYPNALRPENNPGYNTKYKG